MFVQTQVALLLPLLVSSHQAKLGPYDIDSMSVIYRGIYMYSTKDSPKTREVNLQIYIEGRMERARSV